MLNRRQDPRYSVNVRVDVFGRGLSHVQMAQTENISTSGLFVVLDDLKNFVLNETIHLRIFLTDQDAFFDVKAKIIRIELGGQNNQSRGLGVQFVELTEPQNKVIHRFLAPYAAKVP